MRLDRDAREKKESSSTVYSIGKVTSEMIAELHRGHTNLLGQEYLQHKQELVAEQKQCVAAIDKCIDEIADLIARAVMESRNVCDNFEGKKSRAEKGWFNAAMMMAGS